MPGLKLERTSYELRGQTWEVRAARPAPQVGAGQLSSLAPTTHERNVFGVGRETSSGGLEQAHESVPGNAGWGAAQPSSAP